MQKIYQFSVENRINENTMAKELINLNKDCVCVAENWWKTMEVNYSSEPTLWSSIPEDINPSTTFTFK